MIATIVESTKKSEPVSIYDPKAIHVALDLETLGTTPGSIILEIGAHAFTLEGDNEEVFSGVEQDFDSYISQHDSSNRGFTTSTSTIDWWSKQDTNIRNKVFSGQVDCYEALVTFAEWLEALAPKEHVFIWGNSPEFDQVLLAEYYASLVITVPWNFRNSRDFRTLTSLFPSRYKMAKECHQNLTPHNGLTDAIWEAKVIKHMLTTGSLC